MGRRNQTAKGKKESDKYVCWVRTVISLISDLLVNLDTPSESSTDGESIGQQKRNVRMLLCIIFGLQ
jgi:hypothetical protein